MEKMINGIFHDNQTRGMSNLLSLDGIAYLKVTLKFLAVLITCTLLVACLPIPGYNTGYCGYFSWTASVPSRLETEYCYQTREQCEAAMVETIEVLYEGYQVVTIAIDKSIHKRFEVLDENGRKKLVATGRCQWMITNPSRVRPKY